MRAEQPAAAGVGYELDESTGVASGERARYLVRIAEEIEARAEPLALTNTRENGSPISETRGAAVKEISMAKLFAGDLLQRVAYDCMQFHGGMGYVTETVIARGWRDARLITIGGGTSEIMKEIIAKLVPGL